jgi:hypothetical protein
VDRRGNRAFAGFVARRVRTDPVLILLTGPSIPAFVCSGRGGPWPALEMPCGLDRRTTARSLVSDPDAWRPAALIDEVTPGAQGAIARRSRSCPPATERTNHGAAASGTRCRSPTATAAVLASSDVAAVALLLLAAAEDRGDRLAVQRAGAEWDFGTSTWDDVARSGLLRTRGGPHRVRHPLIPRRSATPHRCRAARGAIARSPRLYPGSDRGTRLAPGRRRRARTKASPRCSSSRPSSPCAAGGARRPCERCGGRPSCPRPRDAARRLGPAASAAWDAVTPTGQASASTTAERLDSETDVARAAGAARISSSHRIPERAHHHLVRDMEAVSGARSHGPVGVGGSPRRLSAAPRRPPARARQRLLAVEAGETPRCRGSCRCCAHREVVLRTSRARVTPRSRGRAGTRIRYSVTGPRVELLPRCRCAGWASRGRAARRPARCRPPSCAAARARRAGRVHSQTAVL